MVCHFVDDRVMPGTLMYECCLHTLRIFLMRAGLGWCWEQGGLRTGAGIANRLKCRGQIVESTRVVTYEVTIKELGYRPEPYAIADALILADGKPIVAVTDMALQLSGSSQAELEQLWNVRADGRTRRTFESRDGERAAAALDDRACASLTAGDSSRLRSASRRTRLAWPTRSSTRGGSSRGLPGPPYQFIDRITRIDARTLGDGGRRFGRVAI